ncbi:hypothetical protein B566_EDAN007818 [Ephemera danica]|nr:hypothetical protein B566_EDAN007818 [Ephemera danica]
MKRCALFIALIGIVNESVYANNINRNWYGASDYCKSRGMELVTIETEAENKALEQKVKDYFGPLKPGYAGIYWIGLNDLGKEGEFRWASTGKEADFTHWFPNEPSNKGYQNQPENCASVDTITTGTGWNDLDCTAEHYFICELHNMKHILLFLIVIANVFADDVNQFENGEQDPASTEANGKAVDATGLTKIRNRYYYFSTNANETVRGCYSTSTIRCTNIQTSDQLNSPCQYFVREFHNIQKPAGTVCSAASKANVLNGLSEKNNVKSWHEASDYCKSRGMDLATIESEAENNALVQKVNELLENEEASYESHFWIGLNDLAKEGEFHWASTGTVADYSFWHPGEPNNVNNDKSENCVHIWKTTERTAWNDMNCDHKGRFICEMQ